MSKTRRRYSAVQAAHVLEDFQDSDLDEDAPIPGPGGDDDNVSSRSSDSSSDCDSDSSSTDSASHLPLKKRVKFSASSSSSSSDDESQKYASRSGQVWIRASNESDVGRAPSQNIFRANAGITTKTRATVSEDSKKSAFSLLIDEKMLRNIRRCTETEASRVLGKTWILTLEELETFIGLCYLRGVLGGKNLPLHSFWSDEFGVAVFKQSMARDRFYEIMRFLRFDIKSTRKERLNTDKFALASELWNPFIENCQKCFIPSQNLTVDEQLFPCKSRCPFTQFLPNKPDKYGIKFFLLVDVETKYLCNGFPYLGKYDPNSQHKPFGEFVVHSLMKPLYFLGYGVTTDNFFTSVNLCNELKEKHTSLVGTINTNRRDLPDVKKIMADKALHDTEVLRAESGCTLTLYKAKKSKTVCLISSLHRTVHCSAEGKRKPDTILHYNKTKVGVDCIDQMAKLYTTKAASRRWPVAVFFNVLDLVGINSWILYRKTTNSKISRRQFLLDLGKELTCFTPPPAPVTPVRVSSSSSRQTGSRQTCSFHGCRNKTQNKCACCGSCVCGNHAEKTLLCNGCKK